MDSRIKSIEFDEENHRYTYLGTELRGVTGAIGKVLGKSFPDTDIVKLATIYGHDIHKEVENYFNEHSDNLSTEGAKWVVDEINRFANALVDNVAYNVECEVMVSDFIATASKVDIVMRTEKGAYLFDIKTTSHFDREYCSLQLNTYKKLYEHCYNENVLGLFVLGTKSKRLFKILSAGYTDRVEKILRINYEKKDGQGI